MTEGGKNRPWPISNIVEKEIEYPISEYRNGYSPVIQVPHQSNYDIIVNVAISSNTLPGLTHSHCVVLTIDKIQIS